MKVTKLGAVGIALLVLFLTWRQPILNVLGVSRHFLSGVHSVIIMVGGVYCLISRFKNNKNWTHEDWVLIGILVAFLGCLFSLPKVTLAQAIYGYAYYVFIPLYVYFPYTRLYDRYSSLVLNTVLVIYVLSVIISVFQFFEIDTGSVFATDESVITKYSFFGTVRVNGLVGNFVNYACLSYLVFLYALTGSLTKSKKIYWLLMLLSGLAILMTFTRAYIFLAGFTCALIFIRYFKISLILWFSVVISVLSLAFSDFMEPLLGVLMSEDRHTQVSNQVRIEQFQNTVTWLDKYLFLGEGTGFLLGPNEFKKQWVTDGLFYMFIIELGTVMAFIYLCILLVLILPVLKLNIFSKDLKQSQLLAFLFLWSYLAVAFINSAHAEFVTMISTYILVGLYLRQKNNNGEVSEYSG